MRFANLIDPFDCSLNFKIRCLLYLYDLQHNAGFTWDDKNKVFVGRDISWHTYNESNVEYFKKILDKPFPFKRQLDILCGKTTA
ncbi:hypothetical protein Taro_052571 [Colocasia esculenta]|uniref:Myb/SANT-like domain-containing protein n=1 Tax=Colocasia esculenta TaxID=4460 RepID=A0A843XIY8_COLES|nr:hypothetical protein [Colocasia esculenta]